MPDGPKGNPAVHIRLAIVDEQIHNYVVWTHEVNQLITQIETLEEAAVMIGHSVVTCCKQRLIRTQIQLVDELVSLARQRYQLEQRDTQEPETRDLNV